MGKRIGYVDYKLENFHANVYLAALRKELKERGFAISGCLGLDETVGRQWAEKNGVPYFSDPEQLNENCDYFCVLAPSNPELHLELCQKCFRFGKPTYVDKTFAPDLATAKKIFALADKHKVPVQTTSALRYTNVQAHAKEVGAQNIRHMVAFGGGSSFGEYAIHPAELVVSCMGPQAKSVMRRGTENQSQVLVDFSGGRTAVINVYCNAETPFAAAVTTDKGTKLITVDCGKLFIDMAAALLDFFETGEPNIDRKESLTIRKILDTAGCKEALRGFVEI